MRLQFKSYLILLFCQGQAAAGIQLELVQVVNHALSTADDLALLLLTPRFATSHRADHGTISVRKDCTSVLKGGSQCATMKEKPTMSYWQAQLLGGCRVPRTGLRLSALLAANTATRCGSRSYASSRNFLS